MLGLCLLAGVLLAGVMAPVALGLGSATNQVSDSVDSISASLATTQVPLVTTVEDKDGNVIAQLFDQYRIPESFNQISPNMVAALVDIEDHRYYQESGVDVQGMLRAALHDSSGGSTQGASTITQQFVKNYLVDVVDRGTSPQAKAAQAADTDQTILRKLREAKIAIQLDQTMTKNQILTGYLNVVPFGAKAAGPFGIGAAAKAYFNETPMQLTVAQSALLAGMVNNPILYNPYTHAQDALNRRNLVIDDMVKYGSLPAAQGAQDKQQPLGVVPNGPNIPSSSCYDIQPDAGFFCAYAVQYLENAGFTQDQIQSGGYTIKTTMDPTVSTDAKNAVDSWVSTTSDGVANTMVITQPGTTSHNVLAMVANRNYGLNPSAGETSTNLVANVDDEFGGGSTYKLFTTASAFEQGKAGLNTMLNNPNSETVQITGSSQPYPVSNGTDGTPSTLPLWQGLADSPNTGFVNLEIQDGMPSVLQMAYRLGMRTTMMSNQVGRTPNPSSKSVLYSQPQLQSFRLSPSFTLGVAPLSPLEHSNVAATLASGGVWCPPNPIQSVTDRYGNPVSVLQQPCEQVISQAEADTIRNGMSHNTNLPGATGYQVAQQYNWTRPTSAKTGTTQNSESVGYLAIIDGYASSSLVFADGSTPQQICASNPPVLKRDGHCGQGSYAFGASVSAPPFFMAFDQILSGVTNDQPIPNADPNFTDAQDHGPLVPFVENQQIAQATSALQGAGYQINVQNFNSAQPKGTVIGETPQSNQPTGTPITLYVSTGVLPAPPNAETPATAAPGSGVGG